MATETLLNLWENLAKLPLVVLLKDTRNVFNMDELAVEIAQIAVPAALALAADPVASLIDTAFIGHLGPVELAAVGVSIAIFNQVSKIAIFPLVSVTTSFVAEEESAGKSSNDENASLEDGLLVNKETEELLPKSGSISTKRHIPSASSALVIACVLGVLVSIISILCLFALSSSHGFFGIWVALTIFMTFRAYVGLLRIGTGTGPWSFLRK
uniref:Polysaccharide biosynthesis protein C-terminal domain-containing protein n=1 Tax=Manihot esculenta TaxID=3983 RepID=A0A2C9V768_MANES